MSARNHSPFAVELRVRPAAARKAIGGRLVALPSDHRKRHAARKAAKKIEWRPVGRDRLRWRAAPFAATYDLSLRLAGCEDAIRPPAAGAGRQLQDAAAARRCPTAE